MRTHLAHIGIAGILALLCCLFGCSQSTTGYDAAVGFTLDPVGVQIRVKALPQVNATQAWTLDGSMINASTQANK